MKFACVFLVILTNAAAQFEPDSAGVLQYFPLVWERDLVEGDSADFSFHNPHFQSAATCELAIFSNGGAESPVDLGSGPQSKARFFIPAKGSRTLRTVRLSGSGAGGWAQVACTLPVQSHVSVRLNSASGRSVVHVPGLEPTSRYRAWGTRSTRLFLGNVFTTDLPVQVVAFDAEGAVAGQRNIVLCGRCQRMVLLSDYPNDFPVEFEGTIMAATIPSTAVFAVSALSEMDGTSGLLPAGGASWPTNHTARIYTAYLKLLTTAREIFPGIDLSSARLDIPFNQIINASASRDGTIRIHHALAELVGDSRSELAAVIAHEIAHLIQFRANRFLINPRNPELDADAVGALLCLVSGYDPYASAGVFGKLMTVTRRTDLFSQTFDNLADPHTSFTNRMAEVFQTLTMICATAQGREYCALYKSVIHPSFPEAMPLSIPAPPVLSPLQSNGSLKE